MVSTPKGAQQQKRTDVLIERFVVLYVGAWILEGALRKWVLPGFGSPLYFAHDAVAVFSYAALLFSGHRLSLSRLGLLPLFFSLALLMVAAVQALVEDLPIGVVIVGVVTYASPAISLCLFALHSSRDRVIDLAGRLVMWSLLLQALLTIIQTASPRESFWNSVGSSGDVGLFTSGDVVRATGTFTSPSGLTAFTGVAVAITVSRFLSSARVSAVQSVNLVCCVVLLALGGSRGALGLALVCIASALAWVALAVASGRRAGVRRFLVTIVAAVAAYFLVAELFATVLTAFTDRIEAATRSESFVQRLSASAFSYAQLDATSLRWFGDGLGTHTLAGRAAGSKLPWEEVELTRWVMEFGHLGLLAGALRQLCALALIVAGWRSSRLLDKPMPLLLSAVVAPALLVGSITTPSNLVPPFVIAVTGALTGRRVRLSSSRSEQ